MTKEEINEYGFLWLSLMTKLMTKVKLMMTSMASKYEGQSSQYDDNKGVNGKSDMDKEAWNMTWHRRQWTRWYDSWTRTMHKAWMTWWLGIIKASSEWLEGWWQRSMAKWIWISSMVRQHEWRRHIPSKHKLVGMKIVDVFVLGCYGFDKNIKMYFQVIFKWPEYGSFDSLGILIPISKVLVLCHLLQSNIHFPFSCPQDYAFLEYVFSIHVL